MGDGKSTKLARYLAVFAAAGVLIVLFLLLGPPELLAKSEAPIFCGGCHVMEEQFEAWAHAGAHRRKQCVDCHLPNENVALRYFWKSLDGMKDVVLFYSGMAKERAAMSAHGAEVLQANCIRCHSSAVEFIDQDRKCWECHRRLPHRRSGAMATT
ncbi:MAG: cytochrome c nitrite reductase small subunit [Betaproteobacteria bacterium]|nr:cytochrome c nitrite reductase small subunit [Betaproteobacteria bacterium]